MLGVERAAAGGHLLETTSGEIRATYLVNAAGLASDEVDRMLGHRGFTVTPRRGQLVVFDKLARTLVSHILLPVPTARGKGVLVAPTVYGNVLLGPTAEDLDDKTDTGSTDAGLAALREHGRRILPALLDEEVTPIYAGLRAATEHGDYQVDVHPEQRYVCVGGIRSTGLTASMALAEHVAAAMVEAGLAGRRASRVRTPVRMPNLGAGLPAALRAGRADRRGPGVRAIVCHCERVSLGEVRDALRGPIPAVTPEGLRRRTRAGMGRCQGFFCGALVADLVAGAGS